MHKWLGGDSELPRWMAKPLTLGVQPVGLGRVGRVQAPLYIEGKPDACQGGEVTSSWLIYGEE